MTTLFPPEFIVGVLITFFQVRLRSFFSLASLFVNGLSFFIPPDDELIQRLNGGQKSLTGKSKQKEKHSEPLSPDDKMAQFYIKVANTEHGIFQQTLFFELYEMMIILISSTLVTSWSSDAIAYWQDYNTGSVETTETRAQISVYGLVAVILVCIWFPLQVKFAQGLDTYESRLGLGIGFIGFVVAMFFIFAPKPLFDFDLEAAVISTGDRLEIVLRTIGFVDGDMENIASFADMLRFTLFINIAMLCAVYIATAFLPAFRFARMYAEMVKDPQTGLLQKLSLHLNVLLPLLVGILWIKPLSTDIIVPSYLIHCSPRSLVRDCFGTSSDETTFHNSVFALTESHWNTLRIYIVLLTVVIRLLCFRSHIQFFLVEPKDSIVQIVRRPGLVDGELLKSKIRIQFNYVPIISVQYLAPVGAILAAAILFARQTGTSLGMHDAVTFVLVKCGLVQAPSQGFQWFSSNALLPSPSAPDIGAFRLGDEITRDTILQVTKAMSNYTVITPSFHASLFGFFLWWMNFTWFVMTVGGLIYWKNVPHVSTMEQDTAFGERRNRETRKTLKNQLKGLKMKKH